MVTVRLLAVLVCCIIGGSQAEFCPPDENIKPCFCVESDLRISCSERDPNLPPWDIKATLDYISTTVPEDFVFGQLVIIDTKLMEIPAEATQSVKFGKIRIDFNDNLEFIHPDAFNGTLDFVGELEITNNARLSNAGPNHTDDDVFNVIRKFKNLNRLNVYSNNLTFLPPRAFEGLSELTYFQSGTTNGLGSQVLSGLPKLDRAVIGSRITLENIAEDAFVGVGPETVVDLRNNPFTRLPENIFKPLLDNGKSVLVGGSICQGFACTRIEMDCDEVSAWICKDVLHYRSKVDGFLCRGWSGFVDIFDYCFFHKNK